MQFQQRILQAGAEPIDGSSIALFRVFLGAILFWEVVRYFWNGWIHAFYVAPGFYFPYPGFGWLQPLPGFFMYTHFVVLGAAALLVALGLFYRIAIVLLAAGWTYVLLLDQTTFLNHLYLLCLICGLMCLVPADAAWSCRRGSSTPQPKPATWHLWVLRTQLAIPYVYGGLVKLNPDWLQGQPLHLWMSRMDNVRAWIPWVGERWLALVFSYSGILIDLAVVPCLLWRPTRYVALAVSVSFHLLNNAMFQIGVFPWFMIVASTLFLLPDWPARLLQRLRPLQSEVSPTRQEPVQPVDAVQPAGHQPGKLTVGLLVGWFALQLLFPWRHFLYSDHVAWTEEGTRFSWRMMLNDKWSALRITVVNPKTRVARPVNPNAFLSSRQVDRLSYEPELLRLFAHFLADISEQSELGRQEVHAEVWCSLNGRKPQLLIDPNVDLAAEPPRWHQPWILELREPLPLQSWTPPEAMRPQNRASQ